MRKLFIIGIGAGNPEHITIQAIRAMNTVEVFFFLNKGEEKDDLVALRREICDRYIEHPTYRTVEVTDPQRDPAVTPYTARVEAWHEQRAILYEELLQRELGDNSIGAILVWGDPSLYDSTLRIIDRILERKRVDFDYEVIPGITSVQALAAAHRIVLHEIGESVAITTGRNLAAGGLPQDAANTVVMLDANNSFKTFADQDTVIYWGAYLGTDKQILLSGRLRDVAETIERVRSEAREANGWIMDIYLLTGPSAS
ncbi:MAG TPA: precorrin-6A synthase (deacetylating) [Acidobacteriaceae bacterium]|jgi:precorrin-6A synthase